MVNIRDLRKKLKGLLESDFPNCSLHLERASGSGRIGGELVWSGFVGKDQLERQTVLSKLMRDQLSRDEQLKLSTILTFTPEEIEMMEEDREVS